MTVQELHILHFDHLLIRVFKIISNICRLSSLLEQSDFISMEPDQDKDFFVSAVLFKCFSLKRFVDKHNVFYCYEKVQHNNRITMWMNTFLSL